MKYKKLKQLQKWVDGMTFLSIKLMRDNDSYCCPNDDADGFEIHYDMEGDYSTSLDGFEKLFREMGLAYDISVEAFVLLHELGHLHNDFINPPSKADRIAYDIGAKFYDITCHFAPKWSNYHYQRMKQEYNATLWAVNFINNNQDRIKVLEEILA